MVLTGFVTVPASAQTLICSGVSQAEVQKCDPAYAAVMSLPHWRMFAGHNCVNYVAWRLGINGVPEPKILMGNARDWAANAKKIGVLVDTKPTVGAIGGWAGKNHLVYVEEVGPGYLITSEDNYPGYYPKGIYRKIKVTTGESAYPTQFLHFKDQLTSAVPKTSGTTKVGSTLTAAAGAWRPLGVTLKYQWLRNGTVIPAATAPKFVLSTADLARNISVRVTGSKTGLKTLAATSAKTPAIALGTLINSAAPRADGTTKVGSTLTALPGTWTPTAITYAYQWLRGRVAIPGAVKSTYVLTAADLGTRTSAKVTGTKAGYTPLIRTSAQSAVVALGTMINSVAPTVSGTPKVASTLTAVPGTWVPSGVKLGYQWFAGGAVVAGATARTFVPTPAQLAKTMAVRVTATKTGYQPLAKTSALTATVAPGTLSNTKAPRLSGSALVGSTLRATAGTWAPTGVTFTYQWFRGGKAVAGGSRTTYKLTTADRGKTIALRVTGKKAGYMALAMTTKSTAVVRSTPSVTVSAKLGAAKVAFVITVKASGVTPSGKVTIKDGTKVVKILTLSKGKASVTLTKQKRANHTYSFSYAGDTQVAARYVTKQVRIS